MSLARKLIRRSLLRGLVTASGVKNSSVRGQVACHGKCGRGIGCENGEKGDADGGTAMATHHHLPHFYRHEQQIAVHRAWVEGATHAVGESNIGVSVRRRGMQ